MSELSRTQLDHFVHVGEADRFSVVATMNIDGFETIVGEARYGFDGANFEFGLSIDDRWQGHGIGSALSEKSGMPRCRTRCRAPIRRHAAFQRRHDRAGQEIRFLRSRTIRMTGNWCASKSTSTSSRKIFPVRAGSSPPASRQASPVLVAG